VNDALVVRVATGDDDLDRAGELIRAAYFSLPGYPRDPDYDHEIGDVRSRLGDDNVVVVASIGEQVVGCLTYVPSAQAEAYEFDDPDGASFRYFGVDPTVQGRGVGAAMVQWCIDRARGDGRQRLWIHTLEPMVSAARLYVRLGFERVPAADRWWDDVHGHAYVLDLAHH
jgi:GNAT superfamily N-acetyltransferase